MSNYPQQQPPPTGGFGGGYPPGQGMGPLYPAPPPKSGTSTGAIIGIVIGVVVLGMVAIFGIFAVLGIYGTRKYIANAKTAEARNGLGMMAKDAAAAYEREEDEMAGIGTQAAAAQPHRLCPSATNPVPIAQSSVSGRKYQSITSEWSSDPGWKCLRYELSAPQYYQYNYASTSDSFTGTAKGDLNGDMVFSTFEIQGKVQDGMLRIAPSIMETNPDE